MTEVIAGLAAPIIVMLVLLMVAEGVFGVFALIVDFVRSVIGGGI